MKNFLQNEIDCIQRETNLEFKRLLDIITSQRDESIQSAQYFRTYQLEISHKLFEMELECLSAEITLEKESLKDKMLINLEEKRRKLEFEQYSFELNDAQNSNYRLPNRKGRGSSISNSQKVEEKTLGRKRKNQNVALLNLPLKEHEIYDDISYFRRMGVSGRRGLTRK